MRANALHRQMRPALLLVLVVGFVVALQVTPAFAASIVVNSTADGTPAVDGACTLREAVQNSNTNAATNPDCAAGSGADVITFSVSGTITLTATATTGQLVVLDTAGLTVTGPITISGSASRVTRIFLIGNALSNDAIARSLTLNNVTVTSGRPNTGIASTSNSGGSPDGNGGCIYVRPSSTLTLSGSTVTNCRATNGGGIYADENSTTTVTSASVVSLNQSNPGQGGGINISTGFLTVNGEARILSNSAPASVGGGIWAGDSVVLNIGGGSVSSRGFIISNSAAGVGGGIFMDTNSSFIGNHARFFSNVGALGSAWFSNGGSSAAIDTGNQGRSCINCCIVNNNGNYAVYQFTSGLNTIWNQNWWGDDWGPRVYDLDPSQSDTSIGSSVSNGDGIFDENGTNPTSPVEVIITDDGTWSTAPTGSWWVQATIAGGPSDCANDTCGPVSSVATTRSCSVTP